MTTAPGWWNALNLFWKIVVGISGGVGTLSVLWKTFTAIREWWITRYDSAVLELLRGRENFARHVSELIVPEPTTVTFMASCLKRKTQRVNNSLVRLERKDKVHRGRDGWQFGAAPPRAISASSGAPDRWKKPWG